MNEYRPLLKTSHGILQFLSFDWFTGRGVFAHIPWTTKKFGTGALAAKTARELKYCNSLGVIIPLALIGYEIVIDNLALHMSLAIYDLASNVHS